MRDKVSISDLYQRNSVVVRQDFCYNPNDKYIKNKNQYNCVNVSSIID